VLVLVGEKAWGSGEGRSKQTAAQAAAQQALIAAEDADDAEE
jgi:dsRNA-specific ribonuclease